MIPVEAHLQRVLAAVAPLTPVRLPLLRTVGLVLSEDVQVVRDLPSFDNSSMDGYAVRSFDVPADALPVSLPVDGEVAAGAAPGATLAAGHALRIMTGAPLPFGADCVVPVEHTDGGVQVVCIERAPEAGAYVRRAGEDLTAGALAVAAGTVITPRHLALLASCDCGDLLVHPRPRVTVLSTGDELVPAGAPVGPGQIVDSNGPLLLALLAEAGAEVRHLGPVPDDDDAVRMALFEAAASSDLVVTSGGVSMGAHDTMKAVLQQAGGVEFAKVAMNPGMPQGVGHVHGTPIITLPGNPVSTFVSFEVFVRPALRRLAGRTDLQRPLRQATLTEALTSPAHKRQFARGALRGQDTLEVAPVGGQGSHVIGGLAQADCLIVIDEEVTALAAGSSVQVMDLR